MEGKSCGQNCQLQEWNVLRSKLLVSVCMECVLLKIIQFQHVWDV
jgi:hypothetical protein